MDLQPFHVIIGFLAFCCVIGFIGVILAPWINGKR